MIPQKGWKDLAPLLAKLLSKKAFFNLKGFLAKKIPRQFFFLRQKIWKKKSFLKNIFLGPFWNPFVLGGQLGQKKIKKNPQKTFSHMIIKRN